MRSAIEQSGDTIYLPAARAEAESANRESAAVVV